MEIIRLTSEMTAWSNKAIRAGKKIALVPTMGYFHEGHLALMRMAAEKADLVVVSLFVNPIQFGAGEDLGKYPRDFDRDTALARGEKVAVLFAPDSAAMYPEPTLTTVSVAKLTSALCGKSRPGHFDGVSTVVAKLFHIVKPHVAVFGKKDFQQLAVIRRMVNDLNWDIDIIGHPIVREPDGLAMSSRNTFLNPEERKAALCLYNAVQLAKKLAREGEKQPTALVREIKEHIASYNDAVVDYITIVDKDSLVDQQTLDRNSWLAMAVYVGETRLIDNAGLFEGD
jgi:pantoate--beta-alanine ligase